MAPTLDLEHPIAEMGTILHLSITNAGIKEYRQYLTLRNFDYREHLAAIVETGLVKSEDILDALARRLIGLYCIAVIETQSLCLGEYGRSSSAVRTLVESQLNPTSLVMTHLEREMKALCITYPTSEGDIHVLSIGNGFTLGHVNVTLNDGRIYRTFTLDIIGPEGSPLPTDLNLRLRDTFLDKFYTELSTPDSTLQITFDVIKSTYSEALDALEYPRMR